MDSAAGRKPEPEHVLDPGWIPQKPRLIAFTAPILRGIFRLFGGFRVTGLENLPAHGAAILACNHLSWADPPAIRSIVRRKCWFMGNDFLLRIPVLGKLLPFYGAFGVSRGRMDREALRRAEFHLKAGDLLCVFPEGGTTVTGTLVPFEGGVALLAARTGVPIVPIAITGTDRVLPMKPPMYPRWARGGITITIGVPIALETVEAIADRKLRIERLTLRVQDAVAAMLPPEYLPEGYRFEAAGT